MTPSSSLNLNHLVPVSQIRTVLERIGSTNVRPSQTYCGGDSSTFFVSFLFDYKGENRKLMYFFGPGSDNDFGACLSINQWGHDEEIIAGLKGAFGGQWIVDDEQKDLEGTPSLEDIAGPSDEDGMLIFIFNALENNLKDRPDLITHKLEQVTKGRMRTDTLNLVRVKQEQSA